ncbi:MAG: TonB family protein [Rubrivivax sp.]
MLVRLLYASRAASGLTPEDLSAILRTSRANNAAHGITGVLCHSEGIFLQVLEGGRGAVNQLYNRIVADRRHHGAELMLYEEIAERRFAGWAMGQVALARLNPPAWRRAAAPRREQRDRRHRGRAGRRAASAGHRARPRRRHRPGPGVGAGTETGIPARAMITSTAGRGSGGVNTAAYSRDTGGGGLAGRATTVVEGHAGGGGGGGAGGGGAGGSGRAGAGGGAGAGPGAGGTLTRSGSGKASRSIEEIKLVFERNKGAIYALYNRALREDSSLQGKVVVQLKIDPSGAVTDCRVLSSELKNDDLERKLVARIRQFDFGAKDVEPMVVSWPVDFLPS